MRARITGGVVGWFVAILPLVAVNVANIAAIFNFQEMVLAGAVAIAVGLLLGGALAGALGGRRRPRNRGGAVGGAAAGGIFAALYLVTLLVLLALSSAFDSAPVLLQDGFWGIIRMLTALAFVAALPIAVAVAAGTLAGRRPPARVASNAGLRTRAAGGAPAPGQPMRLPSVPGAHRPLPPDARAAGSQPRNQRPPASVPQGHGAREARRDRRYD
ncbi:MAG: hypothetical protein ACHQ4H_06285 [Ktedonobacterales bacterium]